MLPLIASHIGFLQHPEEDKKTRKPEKQDPEAEAAILAEEYRQGTLAQE